MNKVNVTTLLRDVSENISDYVPGLDEYRSDAALAQVPLFEDYSQTLLVFASACCVIFMAIGIPGNIITIIALARCDKVRNATAIFIINLSLSNLLFCCFNLPRAASTFWHRSWTHGILLCRLFPVARYTFMTVSLYTVLAITVNRYILISHPTLYPKMFKNRYLYTMIVGIWLMSFGSTLPTYFEAWGRFSLGCTGCTIVPDRNNRSPEQFFLFAAFAIPSLIIIVCYARIWWIVRKTTKKTVSQIRVRSLCEIENTNTPVSDTAIPNSPKDSEQLKDDKSRLRIPCLYSPELSTSCNDSSPKDEGYKDCASDFQPGMLSNDTAKKIRQSFAATFKKSSTYNVKPRLPTKRDKKLLTMIVAIITSFCICHWPIALTKTIFRGYSSANIISYLLIYMSTCINPIVYVVMSNEYRQAYKNCLYCGKCW